MQHTFFAVVSAKKLLARVVFQVTDSGKLIRMTPLEQESEMVNPKYSFLVVVTEVCRTFFALYSENDLSN
jgi:hypothetical protein